jgi:hypothetical protein
VITIGGRPPRLGHQNAQELGPCIHAASAAALASTYTRQLLAHVDGAGRPSHQIARRCALCSANGMPHTYAESLPLGTPGHAATRTPLCMVRDVVNLQQAASKSYFVHLEFGGFLDALILQVFPHGEQPGPELLRHAALYGHYGGDLRL